MRWKARCLGCKYQDEGEDAAPGFCPNCGRKLVLSYAPTAKARPVVEIDSTPDVLAPLVLNPQPPRPTFEERQKHAKRPSMGFEKATTGKMTRPKPPHPKPPKPPKK